MAAFTPGGPSVDAIAVARTDASGQYRMDGLKPSRTGYMICYDPGLLPSPDGQHQYAGQCHNHQYWYPSSGTIPPGSTPLPVAAAARHGGIDATSTFE